MKRLFRRWKLLLALLVILPLVLLGIAQLIATMVITPAWVVRKIEASKNCRADVASVSVNLWSFPARIDVGGIRLMPRDIDADNGKPLKDRLRLEMGDTGFQAQSASMQVDLLSMLTGRVNIRSVSLAFVDLRMVQFKAGGSSLQNLLASPATVEGKPVAAPEAKPESEEPEKSKEHRPFNIADFPALPKLDALTIEHLRIDIRSEKRKEMLRFDDFSIALTDFKLDPKNLEKENHVKLIVSGHFRVLGKRPKGPFKPGPEFDHLGRLYHADLGIRISSDVALFEPATGNLGNLTFDVVLEKGSTLRGVPAMQKISKKMKGWEKFGLKLEPLPDGGTFLEDANIKLAFGSDKLEFVTPTEAQLDSYRIDIAAASWAHFSDNLCDLKTKFTASTEISQKAVSDLRVSLTEKAGKEIGGTLADQVAKNDKLFKEGRLTIALPISGDLSDPEVDDSVVQDLIKDLLIGAVLGGR